MVLSRSHNGRYIIIPGRQFVVVYDLEPRVIITDDLNDLKRQSVGNQKSSTLLGDGPYLYAMEPLINPNGVTRCAVKTYQSFLSSKPDISIKGKYNMCITTPDATTPRGEPEVPPWILRQYVLCTGWTDLLPSNSYAIFRKEGRGYNRMVAIQEWSPQKPGTDEQGDIVFLAVESHQTNDRDK